jgi:AcrR family transcriptional regulator
VLHGSTTTNFNHSIDCRETQGIRHLDRLSSHVLKLLDMKLSSASGQSARGNLTKERLLGAVSELLVEKDDLDVSLRDISKRAGTNIAAVKYHFGSKEALVLTVLREAMQDHAAQQLVGLNDVPGGASLDEIVRAWLRPTLTRASDGGEPLAPFVVKRVMIGGASGLREVSFEAHRKARERFLAMLAERLPFLSRDELAFRTALANSAIAGFAASGVMLDGGTVSAATPEAAARAVRFFVSALVGGSAGDND